MTVTTNATGGVPVPAATDLVTLTVDGVEISVPKGTLIIRAAERVGIEIPRFCDHPLLEPVGACRQCLVDVEGQRKPLASCTTTVSDGMVVHTQNTSPVADKAQQGVMEMLLINHPLDCPVCDKGGECPLQNQAMGHGRAESRFEGVKRTFPKPISISAQVLLDRERCVLCARCTRFQNQIAGDPFIEMLERGALQQVGIYEKEPLESYFSGNTVQICPVGALTSAAYRFRARPFDLVSTSTVCEHCASGCSLRTDHRRGKVMRRLAGNEPAVNEEWNCDKGRFAFTYATSPERLDAPLVRDGSGALVPTSWADALDVAARGLADARGPAGVLVGGRVTREDAYAYAKFARIALGTNDVDFRARSHSAEETAFLGAHVAGTGLGVSYADLEHAPAVLLVGLEPEDESPIVFLRLRKAVRHGRTRVFAVAPFASRGLSKVSGRLLATTPGDEPRTLDTLPDDVAAAVREPGAVLLLGERLAGVPGAFTAAARLAASSGARVAWIPRRAGERGALDAGAFPTLLPGGRPVADDAARASIAAAWGVDALPAREGRDTASILAAAAAGELGALVIGGVDLSDLPDPTTALRALESAAFVVSLETTASAISAMADVVLPVAVVTEKAGTFVDWEGRDRPFDRVFDTTKFSDTRALSALADALGAPIGISSQATAARELAALGPHTDTHTGARVTGPDVAAPGAPAPGAG